MGFRPMRSDSAGNSNPRKKLPSPLPQQKTGRRRRPVRNFGDVERRKYILKKEPGNESSGAGAAQPDVAKTQDRKILPERVVHAAETPLGRGVFQAPSRTSRSEGP